MAKIIGSVSAFIVRGSNGEIDLPATLNAIGAAITSEAEATKVRDGELREALHAVYDRLKVDILQTPVAVATAAAFLVGDNLSAMGEVSNELSEYLDRTTEFVGQRGRKGGLKRVSR